MGLNQPPFASPLPFQGRRSWVAGVAVFVFALVFVLVTVSLEQAWDRSLDEARHRAASFAEALEDHVSTLFADADRVMVDAIAAFPGESLADPANTRAVFEFLNRRTADMPYLGLINTIRGDGLSFNSSLEAGGPALDYTDRAYFSFHRDDPSLAARFFQVVRSRRTGRHMISMTRRLQSADGRFAGVIIASIDPRAFTRLFRPVTVAGDDTVTLSYTDGTLLASDPLRLEDVGRSFASREPFVKALGRASRGSFEGAGHLNAYRQFDRFPLVVTVGLSKARATAEIWRLGGVYAVVVGVLAVALAALVALINQMTQRRESEAKYRGLVDTQIDMVVRFDPEGGITFVNNTVCQKLGRPRDELVGQSWLCLVAPEDRSDMADCLEAACVYHSYSVAAVRFRGNEGVRWYSWEIAAITNPDNTLNEIQAIGRDVTGLKEAQEALRASQERLAFATSGAHVGIWDFDPVSGAVVWEAETYRLYGLEPDSVAPHYAVWRAAVHPDDLERVEADIAATLAGERPYDTEFRVRWPDGEIHHLKAIGQVLRDEDGTPVRMAGIHYDITARRELENRLQTEADRFLRLIQLAPVPMGLTDHHGVITYINDRFQQLFGYDRSDIPTLQDWLRQAYPDPDYRTWALDTWTDAVERAIRDKTPVDPIVFRVRRKDHTDRLVEISGLTTEDGFLATFIDVTGREENEERLREAKRVAEEANQAKSAFVANMSHEIRTPMNAILGLVYLLDQTRMDELQRDYIGKVRLAAQSLLGVLNDILDFSKVEANRLELEATPFRLDDLMSEIAAITDAGAQEKNLRVTVAMAPGTPVTVIGDPLRLRQVLMNLASNAVKFTERGEVTLSVAPGPMDVETVELSFAVRDTGIGIATDHLERIFDAFSQADTSTSRRYGGSGLGLAISQRLVTLMGGEIQVDSEPGRGSVFTFTITLGMVAVGVLTPGRHLGAVAAPGTGPRLDGRSLLLVEDNAINRLVARRILETAGAVVVVASDGAEAMSALMAAPGRFDAVLMDIQMPGMDGYQATGLIRAEPALARLPVIALTANALPADRDRCLAAGMNDHVGKPLDVDQLLRVIARWCGAGAAVAPAPAPPQGATPVAPPEIDMAAGLRRLCGDADLLREIMADFLERYADAPEALLEALAVGDLNGLARFAHDLKTLAGSIGASGLSADAGALHNAARLTGETVERLRAVTLAVRGHLADAPVVTAEFMME